MLFDKVYLLVKWTWASTTNVASAKFQRDLQCSAFAWNCGQSSVCTTKYMTCDMDGDHVMKKPSRCQLGAVSRYWNVEASCFHISSVAENTSAPLAPTADTSQPITLSLLFFVFLLFNLSTKSCLRIYIRPQNLVAYKGRQDWLRKEYFPTFPNILPTSGLNFELIRHLFLRKTR